MCWLRLKRSCGDHTIGIGQVEVTDIETVMPPVAVLRAELARVGQQHHILTTFLLLTDILSEYSLLLARTRPASSLPRRRLGSPSSLGTAGWNR